MYHSHLYSVNVLERHTLTLCTMGGVGLRSASRSAHAAYWGSWADCLATTTRAPRQCGRHHGCYSDGDLLSLHDVVAACRHLPLTAM